MSELNFSGRTVLVVEDEPLLRRQLRGQLERLKAEVSVAESLAAARRCLEEDNFDFALLDVNLPDGLGTDLLKEKAFPLATAVVVMTAQGSIAKAVEAMKLGAADYLTKPFDPDALPLVLARAAKCRSTSRLDEQRRGDTTQAAAVFFFGHAPAEVAKALGKEEGAVRVAIHRLRKR